MLEEEPVPLAAGASGRTGDPQASSAPLATTADTDQDQTPRLLRHWPPPPPAHRARGRHGHERPARSEEIPHVLAILLPGYLKHRELFWEQTVREYTGHACVCMVMVNNKCFRLIQLGAGVLRWCAMRNGPEQFSRVTRSERNEWLAQKIQLYIFDSFEVSVQVNRFVWFTIYLEICGDSKDLMCLSSAGFNAALSNVEHRYYRGALSEQDQGWFICRWKKRWDTFLVRDESFSSTRFTIKMESTRWWIACHWPP